MQTHPEAEGTSCVPFSVAELPDLLELPVNLQFFDVMVIRFFAESDPELRRFLRRNFDSDHVLRCSSGMADVTEPVDIFTCGPPCQPFSQVRCLFILLALFAARHYDVNSDLGVSCFALQAGKGRGVADPRSGPMEHCLQYALTRRPPVWIMENVPGLLRRRHRRLFHRVIRRLQKIYSVRWKAPAP
jgi:site-specific DNA-cytosine methylase